MLFVRAICASVVTTFSVVTLFGALFRQSTDGVFPQPQYHELSSEDRARLDRQRAVVAAVVKERYGTLRLTGTGSDLPVLQKMIDDGVFKKSQTYELQCLGVAFGDVLAAELPLRWVMVTDEFGTDPTLRYKSTTLQVNALTMISKRIERDESVDLSYLLNTTRKHLAEYSARGN